MIKNSKLNEIWSNGFVKVNRLKDYKGYLDGLVRCGKCGKIKLKLFFKKT